MRGRRRAARRGSADAGSGRRCAGKYTADSAYLALKSDPVSLSSHTLPEALHADKLAARLLPDAAPTFLLHVQNLYRAYLCRREQARWLALADGGREAGVSDVVSSAAFTVMRFNVQPRASARRLHVSLAFADDGDCPSSATIRQLDAGEVEEEEEDRAVQTSAAVDALTSGPVFDTLAAALSALHR